LEHQEEEGKLSMKESLPNEEARAGKPTSGERRLHHLKNSPSEQIPLEGRKCNSIWNSEELSQ